MAYESTIVSTNAEVSSLRRALLEPDVVQSWPGFREREPGADARWRARREAGRSFPSTGVWDVAVELVRDDVERPEVAYTFTAGRTTVVVTAEVWSLSPRIRVVRVGVRHGTVGRLRYAPRKLRAASQAFGKALAAQAGGEVLERVGIETVQGLGILGAAEDGDQAHGAGTDPLGDVDG